MTSEYERMEADFNRMENEEKRKIQLEAVEEFTDKLWEEVNDATILVQVPVNDKEGGHYESDEAILVSFLTEILKNLLVEYKKEKNE